MAKRASRLLLTVATFVASLAVATQPANAAPTVQYAPVHKINVLGEWAHPDDDTSIIGPCGVWHQR
jgi:hypothetical protein